MCTGDCLSLSITHGTVRLFISFYLFWENYGEYCSNKSSYEDIGSGWYRVRTETSFYYSPYVFPNCTRNDSGSMGTFNDDEKDIQIQAGMKFGMCDFFPAALMWSEPPTTEFWGDAALETDIYMKRPTIEGQPTIEELAILDEIVHSLQGVDMMPTLQQDVAVTQDEMNNLSDWISYTDPLYNYGFIYPSTWGSGGSVLQDDQFRYLSSSLFPNRVKVLDHVNRQFCGTSIAIYPEGGLSVNLSDFHPSTTKITSREVTSNSLGEFTILTDWNIPAFPDFEIRVLQLDETAKRILDSLTFPVL